MHNCIASGPLTSASIPTDPRNKPVYVSSVLYNGCENISKRAINMKLLDTMAMANSHVICACARQIFYWMHGKFTGMHGKFTGLHGKFTGNSCMAAGIASAAHYTRGYMSCTIGRKQLVSKKTKSTLLSQSFST